MKIIPYSTQNINNADIRAVGKTLRSARLTQGPAVEHFEKALTKKTGTKYAVVFNSGTAALHAAYFAAGIGKGDEVIMPALTFAATGNAALYLSAKPVFADVDPISGTLSVSAARKLITRKTKALVPVDYGGHLADIAAFKKLARSRNLVLIVDGAQSLGAEYRGKPAGGIADMTTYSFHPVKSITTGEGGAVVTNSPMYAHRLELFRTHGITKERKLFEKKTEGAWYMEMYALGFNYRMSDINAALGESQLKRLDSFIAKRRAAARHYNVLLGSVDEIILPTPDTAISRSAWHLYTLRLKDSRKRRAVFDYLRSHGIGVQVHHIPVYTHPFYQKLGYKAGLCPQAESWYASELSLPIFAHITLAQQKKVVQVLKQALA